MFLNPVVEQFSVQASSFHALRLFISNESVKRKAFFLNVVQYALNRDNVAMNDDQARLSKNLKKLRAKLHLTQDALAERAELSTVAIMQFETGKRWPRPKTMAKLAEALSTTAHDLAYGPVQNVEKSSQSSSTEELFKKLIDLYFMATDEERESAVNILEKTIEKRTSKSPRTKGNNV